MSNSQSILDGIAAAGLSHWDAAPFLQKVTDIAPSIIYVFNQLTQSNEYSNHSLGASLGYSTRDVQEMGDALIPTICHPDDLAGVVTHFERIRSLQDGEVITVEYRVRHQQGRWVWLLSYDTVFDRDPDGKVIRHIGAASDITAQKEAEEQAKSEAIRAQMTKDELCAFSYALSHDMKSPSNTLCLVLTELLEAHGPTLDPDATQLIEMALSTADGMGQMLDNVQNYTRVVNQDTNIEAVALTPLVNKVISDIQCKPPQQEAIFYVHDLPKVRADPVQMVILFQNLIANAIAFARPGQSPEITISALHDPNDKQVTICVADNGIGIPADQHEKIFTIFKRLNPRSQSNGSGLGLPICRRIATNHGSNISLVSLPGQGSAFSMGLTKA